MLHVKDTRITILGVRYFSWSGGDILVNKILTRYNQVFVKFDWSYLVNSEFQVSNPSPLARSS